MPRGVPQETLFTILLISLHYMPQNIFSVCPLSIHYMPNIDSLYATLAALFTVCHTLTINYKPRGVAHSET